MPCLHGTYDFNSHGGGLGVHKLLEAQLGSIHMPATSQPFHLSLQASKLVIERKYSSYLLLSQFILSIWNIVQHYNLRLFLYCNKYYYYKRDSVSLPRYPSAEHKLSKGEVPFCLQLLPLLNIDKTSNFPLYYLETSK